MAPHVFELADILPRRRRTPAAYWRSVKASRKLVKQATLADVTNKLNRRPHAKVVINGEEVAGLFDSGASISCLGKDALKTVHKCKLKWK